ncbi:RDD family protein [Nocardioides sp.]|uniref:RDD family protein n=1 Tax=Nocardioides sp. TaxID=35761 RepID=UPI002B267314|nr:RDD family protein [Nocardioides sp.]
MIPQPAATVTYPAAELDRRFYAFVLDRLLAYGLLAVVGYVAWRTLLAEGRTAAGVAVVVSAVLLVSLAHGVLLGVAGVSPGKAVAGLRVVGLDGAPIGVPLALLRVLLLGFLTLPTGGIGLATLAWTAVTAPDGRHRGVHDLLTHAVVVDVRPVPAVVDATDARPRQIVNLTALRLLPAPRTPMPVPAPVAAPTQPLSPPPSRPPAGLPTGPPTGPPPSAPPSAPPTSRPPALTEPAPARPAAAPGAWRVSFDTGEEFVVEGLALVGRRPEPRGDEPVRHVVALPSSDISVSKTHAQFQVVPDGALVVMDRGSTNGSVLVRQGVSRPLSAGRPATLLDGDTVCFGDRTMTVTREHR